MPKMHPLSHKVKIVGRRINLYEKTDLGATFRRIRAQQAILAKQQAEKEQANEKEVQEKVKTLPDRKRA